MTSREKSLYFQVVFATIIWGGAYPFTKHAVTEISPLTLITLRGLIGVLLLILFSRSSIKLSDFRPGMLWKILFMSILGVSAQQYGQAYALKYTLATNAGWLIAVTPIIIVAMGLFLGEKLSPLKSLGFLFGSTGTLLIISSRNGFSFSGGFISSRGDLIFLATCIAWAFYVILTRKWFEQERQAKITTLTMLVALVTVLPFFFAGGCHRELANLTPKGLAAVLYLSVLSSAMAYLFWNNSVEGLGTVKSSYFMYDEPFATVFTAYFFLGELISPYVFAGGFLILCGVYFVNCKGNFCFWKRKALNG